MKKTNNKGFSLVELIIVIAIMVVLVAVIAPQYLKFVNNSRVSTDVQTAAEMATAIDVAIANGAQPFDSSKAYTGSGVTDVNPSTTASRLGGTWTVTGDSYKGVERITLTVGGTAYECYPNPETGIAAPTPSGLKK